MMPSLDYYLTKPEPETPKPKALAKTQLDFKPETPNDMAQSYFVGAGYDGERRAVFLKLYEPEMIYSIGNGQLNASGQTSIPESAKEILPEDDAEYSRLMVRWLRLLESPVPNYRRV